MKIKFIKIATALSISMVVIILLLFSPFFLINDVEVEGNNIVDSSEILEKANVLNKNLFLVSNKNIEKDLEGNPFIASVSIKKEFPHKIILKITERIPNAYVFYNDLELFCIDKDGIILDVIQKDEKDENLLVFTGIKIESFKLGEQLKLLNKNDFMIINEITKFSKKTEINKDISSVFLKNTNEVHLYIYNIDFTFDAENSIPSSISQIKPILEKIPNYKEVKAIVNLDTKLLKFIT